MSRRPLTFSRRLSTRLLAALLAVTLASAAACQPEDLGYGPGDLPDGDATRGAQLFSTAINGAPACSACHAIDGSAKSGPTLDTYGDEAAQRVKDQDAVTYTFYSILRPAKHLVSGYSNVMYSDYASKLARQDLADLIAYLITLHAN